MSLKQGMNVQDMAIDGNNWLVAGYISGGDAVQHSVDGGKTWTVQMTSSAGVRQVAMDGSKAVAIDENRNIHWSKDGGKNWSVGAKCAKAGYVYSLALKGDVVLAGAHGELCRSKDLGANLDKTLTPFTAGGKPLLVTDVAFATVKGATRAMLIGYTYDANQLFGVYDSTDLGVKWSPVTSFPGTKGRLSRLALGADGKAFVAGDQLLHRSPDQGKTWYTTSTSIWNILSMGYESPGTVILGSSNSGYGWMYRSIDGGKSFTKENDLNVKYGKGVNSITFDGKGYAFTGNGYGTKGTLQKASW